MQWMLWPEIVAEFHPYKAFLVLNELEKLAFDPSSIRRREAALYMAQFTLTCKACMVYIRSLVFNIFFFEKCNTTTTKSSLGKLYTTRPDYA